MKPKIILLIGFFIAYALTLQAQNPYTTFGCKAPVLETKVDADVLMYRIVSDNKKIDGCTLVVHANKHLALIKDHTENIIAQFHISNEVYTRWLSPDPKNQYHSPYLGMGNNPTNGVDPDGGWTGPDGDIVKKGENGGLIHIGTDGNEADKNTYLVTKSNDIALVESNTAQGLATNKLDLSSYINIGDFDFRMELVPLWNLQYTSDNREFAAVGVQRSRSYHFAAVIGPPGPEGFTSNDKGSCKYVGYNLSVIATTKSPFIYIHTHNVNLQRYCDITMFNGGSPNSQDRNAIRTGTTGIVFDSFNDNVYIYQGGGLTSTKITRDAFFSNYNQ